MNMLLLKKTRNSLNHMIFGKRKNQESESDLEPSCSLSPLNPVAILRTEKKNTPRHHTASNAPPNWRVPVLIQSAFLTHPASDDHRQGTPRLRQNRPRSRELRLRCYDLLSYTTPGVCSRKKKLEENPGKTGRLEFSRKKHQVEPKEEQDTLEKNTFAKKKQFELKQIDLFFGRGYSTFWGWMIEKL